VRVHSVQLPERDFVAKPVKDYLGSTSFKTKLDAMLQKELDRVEKEVSK
jgi:hypothetical protein